jgi:hypothetical protein
MSNKIEGVYVFVTVEPDGREGIMGVPDDSGQFLVQAFANDQNLPMFEQMISKMQHEGKIKQKIKLVHFGQGTVLKELA